MTETRSSGRGTTAGSASPTDESMEERVSSLFQSVVERVPDVAMFTLDPQGVIQSWNIGAARLTGYSRSEILGRHVSLLYADDVHPGSDSDQGWTGIPEDPGTGKELRVARKNGILLWADVSFSEIRDEEGRLTGYTVLARDGGDYREAREAQRRLTSILEGTTDFMSFADMQGRILYLNAAGRSMLGIGPDEDVAGMTLSDVHPPWAEGILLREALPALCEKDTWSGETALRTRDGQEIPVHQVLVSHRGVGRDVDFVSTIARDITERKRLEERQALIIEASRRLSTSLDYRQTLRNLVQAVVPRLADWCVITALEDDEFRWVAAWHEDPAKQSRLEELLDRKQPLDRNVPVGLHRTLVAEEPELVRKVSEQWLKAAVRTDETLAVVRELGARSAIFAPLIARGRTLGAIGFIYAESGRTYDENDLNLARELAGRAALYIDNARLFQAEEEAVRARDDVLSIVAHDLRNPLGRILMGADFLLEISSGNEMERRQLEIVRRAADGMNRLIQDLLEVTRIESGGGLAIEPERQAVAPLLAHAFEMLRPAAEEKGLRLGCILPDEDLTMMADRDRFLQIMSNLIGNAVKFTERGEITVRANRAEGEVCFSVGDTGPGIAEDDLAHVFERLWQARQSRRAGAGLGLAITRGIVEAHGGRIWVESEVGRGTTFYFTVPEN